MCVHFAWVLWFDSDGVGFGTLFFDLFRAGHRSMDERMFDCGYSMDSYRRVEFHYGRFVSIPRRAFQISGENRCRTASGGGPEAVAVTNIANIE